MTRFSSRRLVVACDHVVGERTPAAEYEHVQTLGGVTVLAADDSGRVVVVQRTVYTHQSLQWQLPGGEVPPGGDAATTARQQLRELTGFQADRWHPMGVVHGADTVTDHRDTVFLAQGLTLGPRSPVAQAGKVVVRVLPFRLVLARVLDGGMPHAATAYAVLAAHIRGYVHDVTAPLPLPEGDRQEVPA
ncbi:MAG: NUDIX domain-containing protein [Phycicoccus sp.]